MRNRWICAAAALLAVGSYAWAEENNDQPKTVIEVSPPVKSPLIEMPSKFYVTEHWLSWTRTFDIETDSQLLGTVHRKWLSLRLEYDFYDIASQLQARAIKRIFSFGAVFDVYDAKDADIGSVDEHIFTFFDTFSIYSPSKQHLATAQMNFWGTKYTMTSPLFPDTIATLSRSFFRLKDNWTVDIFRKEAFEDDRIDPRLFIVLMAFQTDIDHWRKNDSNGYVEIPTKGQATIDQISKKKQSRCEIAMKELSKIKAVVGKYRSEIVDAEEPTEADFVSVENKTDAYLESLVANTDCSAKESCEECERIINGCEALLPLLEQNEMPARERSALILMLERQLETVDIGSTFIPKK